MRDLTKSMLSFSWAMSLYGLRQMACLLSPRAAADSFDAVTRSTEDQLGAVTQSVFRAGDNLQRGMVDLMFNVMTLGTGSGSSNSSSSSTGGAMRRGADAMQRSMQAGADLLQRSAQTGADVLQRSAQTGADVLQRTAQATTSPSYSSTSSAAGAQDGWGPVPPPGY